MLSDSKINRKEQIERVSCHLFKEKGYPATSMRDIAHATGIEAASLYSHIRSKEEILQNVCFRMAERLFAALDLIESSNQAPIIRLEKAMIAHIEVINENQDAAAVALNEWKHMTGEKLIEFSKIREDYELRFLRIIKDGIQSGDFKNIDAKLTMLTVLASINWTHNWYNPEKEMTPTDLAMKLSNFMIHGLKV